MFDPMTHPSRRRAVAALVLGLPLLLASVAPPASAEEVPADATLREFLPIGEYVLEVGGKDAPEASIYFSEVARAYLVVSERLPSAVILWPRTRDVEAVPVAALRRRGDGGIDLPADAETVKKGQFQVAEDRVAFAVDGARAALEPKPDLLGPQALDALGEHSPEYRRTAADYRPSAPILRRLKEQPRDVRIEVYFGSWCPFCKQMVPRIMRVAEELEGSRIRVEFYGLPQPLTADPASRKMGISGVPTGIVFLGGTEVGRITGNDWKVPELALSHILADAG